jgi:hypothetical protein
LTIAQVVWENERAFRSEDDIRSGLLKCTSPLPARLTTSMGSHGRQHSHRRDIHRAGPSRRIQSQTTRSWTVQAIAAGILPDRRA